MNRSRQGRMTRKSIIGVWLIALALVPFRITHAQQSAKVSKIGLIGTGPSSGLASLREVFPEALRELGYVEGKNIAIEYRYADKKLDRLARADKVIK
jgi:putative tryptophan/tyrosine transport system substrate-binding protein